MGWAEEWSLSFPHLPPSRPPKATCLKKGEGEGAEAKKDYDDDERGRRESEEEGEKNDVWVAWPGLGLDAATVWMVVGENGAAETKVAADDDDDDTG